LGKKGWSKGRAVSLQRLRNETSCFDYLTSADKTIVKAIEKESGYGRYASDIYSLSGYKMLTACVNHPGIYLTDNPEQPIEIVKEEPALVITQSNSGYLITMPGNSDLLQKRQINHTFEHQSGNRYQLVYYTDEHRRIANVVGNHGLQLPQQAKQKALESINAVASLFNIQSDITGLGESDSDLDTDINQIKPDQHLYINLQPKGAGLQIDCRIAPLGPKGPDFVPGLGSPMVAGKIGVKQLATNRNLTKEKSHFDKLKEQCPMFFEHGDEPLVLDDPEVALTCLETLQLMQDSKTKPDIVLLWPKGKAVTLTRPTSHQHLNLSLGKLKDWFTVQGE
jgi:hypothetical protein